MKKSEQVKAIAQHLTETGIDTQKRVVELAKSIRFRCVCSKAVAHLVAEELKGK